MLTIHIIKPEESQQIKTDFLFIKNLSIKIPHYKLLETVKYENLLIIKVDQKQQKSVVRRKLGSISYW